MSNAHIPIGKMSDLIDNDIPTQEEKELILEHFQTCSDCSREYDRLRKTVRFISQLKYEYRLSKDLSLKTINAIKLKRRKRYFLKIMPALAASIIVVAAMSIITYNYEIFKDKSSVPRFSDNSGTGLRNIVKKEISDNERIVKIISDQKGKIVKVLNHYVEGEIDYRKFMKLYRTLGHNGFHKIKFGIVKESGTGAEVDYLYKQNIEEVSGGNTMIQGSDFSKSGSERKYVRFRVFR